SCRLRVKSVLLPKAEFRRRRFDVRKAPTAEDGDPSRSRDQRVKRHIQGAAESRALILIRGRRRIGYSTFARETGYRQFAGFERDACFAASLAFFFPPLPSAS